MIILKLFVEAVNIFLGAAIAAIVPWWWLKAYGYYMIVRSLCRIWDAVVRSRRQ